MDTHHKITAAIEGLLRTRADEMRADVDPAMAAIIIETAMEALVHEAVIEPARAFS
jgi:hypothetical protein